MNKAGFILLGVIILGWRVNASIEKARIDTLLETEDSLVMVCSALGEGVWLADSLPQNETVAVREAAARQANIMTHIALGTCQGRAEDEFSRCQSSGCGW